MLQSPQYLVDETGKKHSVVLSIDDYLDILSRLEALEDALALDEARRIAQGFHDYSQLRGELEEEGLL